MHEPLEIFSSIPKKIIPRIVQIFSTMFGFYFLSFSDTRWKQVDGNSSCNQKKGNIREGKHPFISSFDIATLVSKFSLIAKCFHVDIVRYTGV